MKKCVKNELIDLTAGSLELTRISIAVELRIAGKARSNPGCRKNEGSQAADCISQPLGLK